MTLDEQGCVLYQPKPARRFAPTRTLDSLDFLARLLMHVPEPRRQLVRYFGYYSSVQRARRQAHDAEHPTPDLDIRPQTQAERRRARRSWAQLIRRVYELDPLLCQCGKQMRILSFILDPAVITKILRHLDHDRPAQERAPPSSALA